MPNLTLFTVSAVICLDNDGNRVLAKYYNPRTEGLILGGTGAPPPPPKSFATHKDQRTFEKGLWAKTKKPGSDIILYDGQLCVVKHALDVAYYVVGDAGENELMLSAALHAFADAVSMLLRGQVEKRALLENLDLVLLALDETIDQGIIIETDSTAIAARVSRPKADTSDIVINEETLLSAFNTVRDRVTQRIAQL
jgi:hypothetical protein